MVKHTNIKPTSARSAASVALKRARILSRSSTIQSLCAQSPQGVDEDPIEVDDQTDVEIDPIESDAGSAESPIDPQEQLGAFSHLDHLSCSNNNQMPSSAPGARQFTAFSRPMS
jgi:hypothetical protein